jgi:LuxR family maltose regulon positive regulatory protein
MTVIFTCWPTSASLTEEVTATVLTTEAETAGLASWASGDLESAHRTYGEGMLSLQRAGHISDVLGCAITLADIRIAQGRLHDATRTYEQALQLATAHGPSVLRGTAGTSVSQRACASATSSRLASR